MRVRLSVREMMAAVALVGVLLGAFRLHLSLGSFLGGAIAIAAIRTREKLKQRRSSGSPIDDWHRFEIFGRSLGVASLILATSSLPVVLLINDYAHYFPAPRLLSSFHQITDHGYKIVLLMYNVLMAAAGILGFPICAAMRRWLW